MDIKNLKKFFRSSGTKYSRAVPPRTLIKGTSIIMLAPVMLLAIFVFYGYLDPVVSLYGIAFIFIISLIFVTPYIANLSGLTNYVKALAHAKKVEPPDLTFLNNVQELTEAVGQLQHSWEERNKQLEIIVAESNILIDILPDILIMLDQDLQIIRTNSTAKTVFGGKHFKNTLDSIMSYSEIQRVANEVMDGKSGREIIYFLEEPFLRHYIVKIERFPIYSPGSIALIIVMHDITEQRNTEQMLSDFVANASHEIRTPLTSLMGFIETLQNSAKNDENARTKFLQIMKGQSDRMSQLVNGLLSLSQIEKNIRSHPTSKANISYILEEAKLHLELAAKEKNIKILIDINDDIPDVIGDSNELIQVFENLISNAVRYGFKNSDVCIVVRATSNVFPKEEIIRNLEKVLSISVVNKGETIEAEYLPRLTERFYRVDPARSRDVGGMGLGLSIVKYIIDRHRGVLLIDSNKEQTSFTVYLPVSKE